MKLKIGEGKILQTIVEEKLEESQILAGQEKSHDLNILPWPFESDSVEEIRMENILGMVEDILGMMMEIYRICKNGAKIYIAVPWYNSSSAATDCRNIHLFNFTTFDFLLKEMEKEGKIFRLIKMKSIPHRKFRWIPNFKIPFLTRKFRDVIATFIGEIDQYIYVELAVEKNK